MSIFGSLFTAVSAMTAQSQSLSMISNNIANTSTVGYKRTDAAFSSLVTNASRSTLYSPGSVSVTQNARIDQQGILQQSASATDIALSGNGFFVVKKSATDPAAEPLYTRAGSFSEDENGIMKNTGGFVLMGWPLGANGSLPSTAADISSLVPINVSFLGGLTQPTTTASLDLNLDSTQDPTPYPVASGFTPDFTRDIRMFDSTGEGHNMTVSFKKVTTPSATATGAGVSLAAVTGPLVGQTINGHLFVNPESFTLNVPGSFPAGPTTISINGATTLAGVIAQMNAIVNSNGDPLVFAKLDDTTGHMQIKSRQLNTTITLANGVGTPLAGFSLGAAAYAPPAVVAGGMLSGSLPPNVPNTEGWWTVESTVPTVPATSVRFGLVNFGGDGRLNETVNSSGQTIVSLNNIDWLNGSAPQDIAFDIAGFTQFSGEYNVIASNQNGAELGLRTGVAIDEDGIVTAQFSNGQSTEIYKLAVATFANPNGMDELTGNVFRQSDDSGDFNLREAGKGSAGSIQSGALESSNVDLADEFAKMIVTQRAYSANTKVISTADQMTQELLQLR